MTVSQQRLVLTDIPGPIARQKLVSREASIPRGLSVTHPIVVARASGAVIEDVDGNRLIDMASGISCLNIGSCHPAVIDAIRSQAALATHTAFGLLPNEPYLDLADRLNTLAPVDGKARTILVNSGVEAIENAVKIARCATGRPAVVAFDQGFHGRTLLGMSLTSREIPYRRGFGPLAADVHHLPFPSPYRCPTGSDPTSCAETCVIAAIERMDEIGAARIAAVVFEPIQGEGGIVVPARGSLAGIAEYCRANGILLIADEIQTGLGRTGEWFAVEHEVEVRPDLITIAKSLGGGLPIGAVVGRADVMDAVEPGGLGTTFGGNPVAAAAAMAVIATIERDHLLDRARLLGELMTSRIAEIARTNIVGDVRGRGAMVGIELVSDRALKTPITAQTMSSILHGCLARGVVALKAGPYDNVLRLLPPLTIDEVLLDDAFGVIDEVLTGATL